MAGGDLLILRHPEAVHAVKKAIAGLTGAQISAAAA
jgi:CO dehydrogenase/acetyl-CoA synthase delta subunit